MRQWKKSAMVGLLILGSLLASQWQGEARLDLRRMPPSTQPRASKFPLPPAFAILTQHSLFARNGIAINAPDVALAKPEASMALCGIAMDETSFIAFIEDTISHRTLTLRTGDGVAGGASARWIWMSWLTKSAVMSRTFVSGKICLGGYYHRW